MMKKNQQPEHMIWLHLSTGEHRLPPTFLYDDSYCLKIMVCIFTRCLNENYSSNAPILPTDLRVRGADRDNENYDKRGVLGHLKEVKE